MVKKGLFLNFLMKPNNIGDPRNYLSTLQMFTGNYRDSMGKSECRDFKFIGIACIPAIPVILKFHTLISIVIFAGNMILQGYYMPNLQG